MKPPSYISRILLLIVTLVVADGHIAITQLYAWANMIADRTEERGLNEAINSTFSGKEPCRHCLIVEEERNKQSESAISFEQEIQFKLVPSQENLARTGLKTPYYSYSKLARQHTRPVLNIAISPPTPPPDGAIL